MSTEQHEALKLADAYADASFEQGLNQRTEDPAPEKAREALAKELNAMHALIVQLSNALMNAHDHIEMAKLRRSHATDADRIRRAIAAATQHLKGPKT